MITTKAQAQKPEGRKTITVSLYSQEKALLNRLVMCYQEQDLENTVNRSSVLRQLIRNEAIRLGLTSNGK